MTYVINEACIDVKDGDCTNVCPVDCIYEGGRMFYIQPDECVNCAVCVSVCPVEAIFAEEDLPPRVRVVSRRQRGVLRGRRHRLGEPRRLFLRRTEPRSDHPVVAGWEPDVD